MTRRDSETVGIDAQLEEWLLVDELQRRDREGWDLIDVTEAVAHSRYSLTFRRSIRDEADLPSWMW